MLNQTEIINYRNHYRDARLKFILCVLAIRDIRISELLPLKMVQIKMLFTESWMAINHSKHGPASHKAFLTREKKFARNLEKDFEFC